MTEYTAPVCILGGGPAGLTTSLFLSKFGVKHLVIEKSTYPRDKVCGECFDGRVGRILEELDPAYLTELEQQKIIAKTWRYALHLGDTELVVQFPRSNRPKLLSQRMAFDQFLYQKAQASSYSQIITGETMQEVGKKAGMVVLQGENISVQTRLVIVATGAQNNAGNTTTAHEIPTMLYGRKYFKNITARDDKEVEVYYFQKPLRGCLVICPLPEQKYNVEIGCSKAAYKQCGQSLEQILSAYLASSPSLSRRFASAVPLDKMKGTYLPLPYQMGKCADDHYLWAGSNVYSFNPLTGAGVGNAMVMGKLAAEAAQACVEANDYTHQMTRNYERAVRRRLKSMIRFNWSVNLLIRYVHYVEWCLPFFMKRKMVQRILGQTDFVRRIFMPKYWFRRGKTV